MCEPDQIISFKPSLVLLITVSGLVLGKLHNDIMEPIDVVLELLTPKFDTVAWAFIKIDMRHEA